jgi:hypothetical protein
MKAFLGIDPGKKGGLAIVREDTGLHAYIVMPGTVVDIAIWISSQYNEHEESGYSLIMVSERAQPMPKQGIVSAFGYGKHFGGFEAISAMLEMPYHDIHPVTWKKAMMVNSDKSSSIKKCKQIFPTVNLKATSRSTTDHDGLAEAILLAEYGRRINL